MVAHNIHLVEEAKLLFFFVDICSKIGFFTLHVPNLTKIVVPPIQEFGLQQEKYVVYWTVKVLSTSLRTQHFIVDPSILMSGTIGFMIYLKPSC